MDIYESKYKVIKNRPELASLLLSYTTQMSHPIDVSDKDTVPGWSLGKKCCNILFGEKDSYDIADMYFFIGIYGSTSKSLAGLLNEVSNLCKLTVD